METKVKSGENSNVDPVRMGTTTFIFRSLFLFSVFFFSSHLTMAHCDSYDGPVVKDAVKALEENNVGLVLKWVEEEYEVEIERIFEKTYTLRGGDKEIYSIVEKYFLETLVRLHRAGEGEPYTGLKPAGSASQIVKMADHSIEAASVDDLITKFSGHIESVIREKFEKVNELSKVRNESLEKGRAYVSAYVDYTHTLEGMDTILEHGDSAHSTH